MQNFGISGSAQQHLLRAFVCIECKNCWLIDFTSICECIKGTRLIWQPLILQVVLLKKITEIWWCERWLATSVLSLSLSLCTEGSSANGSSSFSELLLPSSEYWSAPWATAKGGGIVVLTVNSCLLLLSPVLSCKCPSWVALNLYYVYFVWFIQTPKVQ